MDIIRDIVQRLPEWCQKDDDGKDAICWMEVDTSHPSLMKRWLKPNLNVEGRVSFVDGFKDLSGLDRFVKLQVV